MRTLEGRPARSGSLLREHRAPLRVLVVAPASFDPSTLLDALRRAGQRVESGRATTAADLRDALRRDSWDLILYHAAMRRPTPARAAAVVREAGSDAAVVVIADPGDMAATPAAGAGDAIPRDRPERPPATVRRARRRAAERAARGRGDSESPASDARLAAVIEAMPSGVAVFDKAGRPVYFNDAARRISGASIDLRRPIGDGLGDFQMRDAASGRPLRPAETATMRALAGETVRDHELVLSRPDTGAEVFLRSSAAPLQDGAGRVDGAVVVFADVTEERRLASIAALADERVREADRAALAAQDRLLAGLAGLAQALAAAHDLTTVFRALVNFVSRTVPCNGLYASLYDAEREERTCVYAWTEGEENDVSALPPMPMNASPHARAVATGEVVVTDDLEAALRTLPRVDLGLEVDPRLPQSSIAVPMAVMGRVVGGFEAQSVEPAAYRPEHVTAMRMAANLAAMAVENVRLLERERRLRLRAQAAVDRSRSLVQNASDAIMVLEPDGTIRYISPAIERLLGYTPAEMTGHSVFETMHPEEAALIAAAAARGEQFDPAVNPPFVLRHRHKDGSWRSLESVVNNLVDDPAVRGIVVNTRDVTERLRADERVRREAARAAALSRVAARLTNLQDRDAMLRAVCEETAAALDVPIVTVSLYDARRDALVLAGAHGLPAAVRRRMKPLPRADYERYTREAGHMVVVEDVQRLATLPNVDLYARLDVRSTVSVTMQREGGLIGRLNVASVGAVRGFTEEDLALLRGIADQAALAIDTARLYGELAERKQELEDLVPRLLATQEEERRRVAYEVHDGLAQVAAAAHQHLQAFAARHRPHRIETRAALEQVLDLTQRTVREARRVVAGLRPTVLDDLGLAAALRHEAEAMQADGWEVRFAQNLGLERLPSPVETALFRIAQEALTNVRKHAGRARVAVRLTRREGSVQLVVQDWGTGFNVHALRTAPGPGERVGLAGMQERAALLRARLRISSRPGRGTRIVADVPVE